MPLTVSIFQENPSTSTSSNHQNNIINSTNDNCNGDAPRNGEHDENPVDDIGKTNGECTVDSKEISHVNGNHHDINEEEEIHENGIEDDSGNVINGFENDHVRNEIGTEQPADEVERDEIDAEEKVRKFYYFSLC